MEKSLPSAAQCPQLFINEAALVSLATQALSEGRHTWGDVEFALEFDYRRGRPDIIAVSAEGFVIAIEAKLRDWREALQQAYRNTCFAALSYILMPYESAARASRHAAEFELRGVGICTIADGSFEVVHPAKRNDVPLEPWLTQRAALFASSSAS